MGWQLIVWQFYSLTGWQVERLRGWQVGRLTVERLAVVSWQVYSLTDWQVDSWRVDSWKVDRLTGWWLTIDSLTVWQVERLTSWQVDRLRGGQFNSLTGWKINSLTVWQVDCTVWSNELRSYLLIKVLLWQLNSKLMRLNSRGVLQNIHSVENATAAYLLMRWSFINCMTMSSLQNRKIKLKEKLLLGNVKNST